MNIEDAPMVECVVMNDEEWAAMVEASAQRNLGVSHAEFVRRWEAGEYHWGHDHPQHCSIVQVAMMLPEVCD